MRLAVGPHVGREVRAKQVAHPLPAVPAKESVLTLELCKLLPALAGPVDHGRLVGIKLCLPRGEGSQEVDALARLRLVDEVGHERDL